MTERNWKDAKLLVAAEGARRSQLTTYRAVYHGTSPNVGVDVFVQTACLYNVTLYTSYVCAQRPIQPAYPTRPSSARQLSPRPPSTPISKAIVCHLVKPSQYVRGCPSRART